MFKLIKVQSEQQREAEVIWQRAVKDFVFYSKCKGNPIICFEQSESHYLIPSQKILSLDPGLNLINSNGAGLLSHFIQ